MKLIVNGEPHAPAPDLATLVEQLGLAGTAVATALNGRFVPVAARAATPLAEGDRVEVLAPMQGG
ncbi:sulfur carrier protein ThiS [Frateuria sp. MAH-13]|uniref:Sulfur carrier protein ThiS n=1 Tax=Frateuria flava TaxID=2821489 RepID=A0ABS4DLQ5_9GAMM|nr:sulfur carrier protein ThiS [Frateuria flava]MBP1473978.1 sulfur carrier protein ThiS [Frateuria flava]